MNKIYYLVSNDKIHNNNISNVYYFDNNSTTLIYDKCVLNNIIEWISCGNPSNILHDFGIMAHNKIEECHHFNSSSKQTIQRLKMQII